MRVSTRTCIGCRQRGAADGMVRLAIAEGAVRVGGPRCGRGASLHLRPDCIEGALRPGVLARAFKRPVDLSAGVAELLRSMVTV